nr:G-type lectin S-receptor-like serine/threonine-protein kinase SD2-5 [Ziziphus jujuba var. spinosa]XP_048328196.1 G-type lectin S-receptor-like serine/threonine-protein kinase SD2-5 [Ziziphus jujuba var. spinosa]
MLTKEEEEDYLDHVPGMPERFSFEDLKAMTQNFHNKLGEGGFGTVFEGTLSNGMKVAVKRLDGSRQIKKSFLAEVATIGSIHHVNLVRMIGFCAEKSDRLLVYQYMPNGSLDKWIFHKTYGLLLSWQQRKKIILDIAKGLSYLHEDCRQKIIHLDIKPENILLDEDFNGKLSDFGLSKLIERDQSQVVTTMRGTPGYLAPEWLGSAITEKVDVYSFGIVTMEIVCGRRNVDRSQPEEAMHLLALFKQKCEENQLVVLIDKCCVDMRSHEAEVINMMKVAAWCLQSDFVKRPSMSMVVKVLEGVMDIEHNMDYDFTEAQFGHREENHDDVATSLLPSVLSQPR